MSTFAYLVKLLRLLLAAGLFLTVVFGEASRSQAAQGVPRRLTRRESVQGLSDPVVNLLKDVRNV